MMRTQFVGATLLFLAALCIAQQQNVLPVLIPPVALQGDNPGTCPPMAALDRAKNETRMMIVTSLDDVVTPLLNVSQTPNSETSVTCPCGGAGSWHSSSPQHE